MIVYMATRRKGRRVEETAIIQVDNTYGFEVKGTVIIQGVNYEITALTPTSMSVKPYQREEVKG